MEERSVKQIKSEDLPEIEARKFEISIHRVSQTGRVYLIDDKDNSKPRVGKVLLIKKNLLSSPIMAIRVIRVYEDKNEFAAKRIKRYANNDSLSPDATYLAIEKISDLKPYQTIEDEELNDEAELDELEKPEELLPQTAAAEVEEIKKENKKPAFRTALPSTSKMDSVLDEEAKADFAENPDSEDDQVNDLVAKESNLLDPDRHMVGADFALVSNAENTGSTAYYAGASFRYGLTLIRRSFFTGRHFQDSLTIEGIAFYYRILNFTGVNDSYTLLPLSGIGRYNFHFSEKLTLFVYGGVIYNYVLSNFEGTAAALQSLGGVKVAAGGGVLIKIGPRWNLRASGGIDSVSVGLALRF